MLRIFILTLLFVTTSSRAPWIESNSKVNGRTSSSLLVEFESFKSGGEDALSYELSYRSVTNTKWTNVNSLGASGNNISASQIVSIRVDDGQTIPAGAWFVLGLERSELIATDFEQMARTSQVILVVMKL